MRFKDNAERDAFYEAKIKEEYERNREWLAKKFHELPTFFKKRIKYFQDKNPDFWKKEVYETFVCLEAVKIATTLKTVDAVQENMDESYSTQIDSSKLSAGHSTFSICESNKLAIEYLESKAPAQ
ncbi:MAG: hypothetical protein KAI57_03930 [Candidatus Pacebacteria bacterium]|nr:hypothetical protein [Candidatus Paceibacterota bacterium]